MMRPGAVRSQESAGAWVATPAVVSSAKAPANQARERDVKWVPTASFYDRGLRYNPAIQESAMIRSRVSIAVPATLLFAVIGLARTPLAQTPTPSADPTQDARTWLGREAEMEAYLRTADMLSFDELSVGVTKPLRAHLAPGAPMKYIVWKTIPPARYGGYWESYKSEIAAYELDKILELKMVPPTVERTFKGVKGAAIMWAAPTKSFHDLGGPPTAPLAEQGRWARQLVKAKMFHNLIADIDPNLGNWLVDPAWNLMLIDFSRCFVTDRSLKHELTRVDPDLWKKMQ